jgi:ATP-binding cassette subfamily C exporter for protease/lipase
MQNRFSSRSEIAASLWALRRPFYVAGAFSFIINMLMLMPTIYMLQMYDRVLGSRNEMTLYMITLITLCLYLLLAGLEWTRSRVLIRVGAQMDEESFTPECSMPPLPTTSTVADANAGQALADLTRFRQFVTGNGVFAFFDAPWFPIYLAVIFILHPILGWFSIGGAVIAIILTLVNEFATRGPLAQANQAAMQAGNFATNNLRNAEVIEAMGMLDNLRARWKTRNQELLALQTIASDRAGLISAFSKFFRISQQSLILGLGAYLVIKGEMGASGMIAGSILMGRALAPVDLLIGSWKGLVGARVSFRRLEEMLKAYPATTGLHAAAHSKRQLGR